MKIAFTHNLKTLDIEAQAEFDTPQTVGALAESLRRLGHDVHLVEVSGPASRLVARLESLGPDLVFNTAEGSHGRYREAFYPALFEQLRLPFTGSDAYVCAVTLDKQASKLMVSSAGVPTPKWVFFDVHNPWNEPELRFPVIVKPNFEGSSKGITQDSVVRNQEALRRLVSEMLTRYPGGVLVEEFIVGRDVTVPFLEKASPETGGVLEPAVYHFDTDRSQSEPGYVIYDYALKNEDSDAVSVQVPADVSVEVRQELIRHSRTVLRALGVRDLARVDFRVTDEGELYFIEVNALPSLEPGASIHVSAQLAGLESVDQVLETVVQSAVERHGVVERPQRRAGALRVGVTYNLKRGKPTESDDREAEFDAPQTVEAIKGAIEALGHEPVLLEATPELPVLLPATELDVVFNIAEGIRGRNREAQIPALLELLNIPYTGSDPAALSITLDKGLAKRLVREAGLKTPSAALLMPGAPCPKGLDFPLIVKPNAEGSSKGVSSASVVRNNQELEQAVAECFARYKRPPLVESYLPGREFTVAILGELEPRALPPMEIVFNDQAGPLPVYTFAHKQDANGEVVYQVPARVSPELERELMECALGCFEVLGCRDVARIDLRLDGQGQVHFIECNPLPGLTPGWSDLCQIAEASGLDYVSLIGEILTPAIRRLRARDAGEEEV